jgi:hypothetical protein
MPVLEIWLPWIYLMVPVIPPFIWIGEKHLPQVEAIFINFKATYKCNKIRDKETDKHVKKRRGKITQNEQLLRLS